MSFNTSQRVFYDQAGSGLIMAMFALIILGLLAAAMVRILNVTQTMDTRELLSLRAFYSAESGAQRMMAEIFPRNSDANACSDTASAGSFTMMFNNVAGLPNCQASVTCSDFVADGERYYTVASIGQCGFASRTVSMQARSVE